MLTAVIVIAISCSLAGAYSLAADAGRSQLLFVGLSCQNHAGTDGGEASKDEATARAMAVIVRL